MTDRALFLPDASPMHRALALAEQALWLTSPNPRVGCVITGPDGQVLGEGHTQRAGGAHAEIMALRDAAARGHTVQGACAWVTLEPCAHQGRTGPWELYNLARDRTELRNLAASEPDRARELHRAGLRRLFMLALRERGLGSAWTTLHLPAEQEAADLLGIPFDKVTHRRICYRLSVKGERPIRGGDRFRAKIGRAHV